EGFVPLLRRDAIFVSRVVPDRGLGIVHVGTNFALGCTQWLSSPLLHVFLFGGEFGIATKQNVGTTAGHVGSDSDHAFATGLGNNFCFLLVILRVQNDVLDALLLQKVRQALGLFDGSCADEHRLPGFVQLLNFIRGSKVFFLLRAINQIWIFDSQQRFVRGNDDDVKVVDFAEFGSFSLRSSGHAGEFFVHTEVILEGDGRERLVLALNLHAFLGFHRLMQAIGPAAAWHETSGEFVNDYDFSIFDHVFNITVIERVRLDGGFDVMFEHPVLWIGDVADAEQTFDFLPAFIGDGDVAMLLINRVVARENAPLCIVADFIELLKQFVPFVLPKLVLVQQPTGLLRSELLAPIKLGNDAVHTRIFVG